MAGNAPRGVIGARKTVAAEGRIAKENLFLKKLRVKITDKGIAELLGTEPDLSEKVINEAIRLARENAGVDGWKNPIQFEDPKGTSVPLVKITKSQSAIRDCQKTIGRYNK